MANVTTQTAEPCPICTLLVEDDDRQPNHTAHALCAQAEEAGWVRRSTEEPGFGLHKESWYCGGQHYSKDPSIWFKADEQFAVGRCTACLDDALNGDDAMRWLGRCGCVATRCGCKHIPEKFRRDLTKGGTRDLVFDPSLSNKQIVFVDSSKVTYGELQAIANADVGEIEPMPKHDCAACGEDLGLLWAVKDGKDCHFTCQPGEPKPTNKEIELKNGSTIRVSENPDGKSGELQGAGWSVIEPEPEISREDYELWVAYMQRQHDRARAWGKILSSLTPKQPPARHPSEPFGWHGRTGV